MTAYLARSSWIRTQEYRRHLNLNLAALPPGIAESVHRDLLRDDFYRVEFEMLTGRFLQVLGAGTIERHPGPTGRRHVDWGADFPDGWVSLEATVPIYDGAVGEDLKRQVRVIEAIGRDVPPGWTALPFRLPDIPEHGSMKPIRAVARRLFSSLPEPTVGARLTLRAALDDQPIEIVVMASNSGPIGTFGSAGGVVDDIERIELAWLDERKREQGRDARAPALLAIKGGPFTRIDAFTQALFGREPGLGVLAVDDRPPWAGVLAFAGLNVTGGPDPVLFPSPHFDGMLPEAFTRLPSQFLVEGKVRVRSGSGPAVLTEMDWVRRYPDDHEHISRSASPAAG